MQKRIYQIRACAEGWRNAKAILIEVYTHEQAMLILYGYALLFNTEVRGAHVTGYEDLKNRNEAGETLGNGIYVYPHQAGWYFERQSTGQTLN